MRPSFNFNGSFPAGLPQLDWRDPRVFMRAILAVLLLATLVALYFLFFPPGGSLEDLERRYAEARAAQARQAANLERARNLAAKVQLSRAEGEKFLSTYFLDRRTTASTIVDSLVQIAKESGIRQKEHTFTVDPVEGAADLYMLTVNGGYEGTYADLIQFLNKIDRSPRFLIIDTLTAAPIQNQNTLNVSVRFHVFVKEGNT
jgi:type IV pilus assembly protein PilO